MQYSDTGRHLDLFYSRRAQLLGAKDLSQHMPSAICWMDVVKTAGCSLANLLTSERAANPVISHSLPTAVGASGSTLIRSLMIGLKLDDDQKTQVDRDRDRWQNGNGGSSPCNERWKPPTRHQGGPDSNQERPPPPCSKTFKTSWKMWIWKSFRLSLGCMRIRTILNFPHSGMRAEEIYWNGKALNFNPDIYLKSLPPQPLSW